MKILLIEDDNSTARSIELILRNEGITCEIAEKGEEGLEKIKFNKTYDLLILDLMLPDIGGFEVLLRLRSAKIKIPVLILSGLSNANRKIEGLGLGADDYLTKPFNRGELIARIRALVRRTRGSAGSVLKFDEICIDLDDHKVKVKNKILHLPPKEYAILELLAMQRDTLVTKETLLDRLYNENPDKPELKIIDVFVCKLREKLYKASGGKNYIETIWGSGYRLKTNPMYKNSEKEFLKLEKM